MKRKLLLLYAAVVLAMIVFLLARAKGGDTTESLTVAHPPGIRGCAADTTESVTLAHPDFGKWLTIVWHGGHAEKPYHPNWTAIVTDYKPVVHKLPYGKWEITFTSELTEGIP